MFVPYVVQSEALQVVNCKTNVLLTDTYMWHTNTRVFKMKYREVINQVLISVLV